MAAKIKTDKTNKKPAETVVAKSEDGSIQITFTIPFSKIKSARSKAAEELGAQIEVPGFRKGKAPLEKLLAHIPQRDLLEKTLMSVLPKLISEAVKKNDLKLAIYPKYELVKAEEGKDWQVRAVTAEIPEFELGDYKKAVNGAIRSKSLWTPGQNKKDEKEAPQKEEKQQMVIKTLIETVKVKIPKVLIDEEVNTRLSRLLERIEKLGLTLDSYLASIGKTSQTLRSDYEKQSEETIALDLILTKVADDMNIKISEKQIEAALGVSKVDPNMTKEVDTPERRKLIEAVLRKRAALESLSSLT
jgi:FKBP-type peptidyl-prolyl cis-trans isomerase (trigger factor)